MYRRIDKCVTYMIVKYIYLIRVTEDGIESINAFSKKEDALKYYLSKVEDFGGDKKYNEYTFEYKNNNKIVEKMYKILL